MLRQDDKHVKRIADFRLRLAYRWKKCIFQAVQEFNSRTHSAKRALKSVFRTVDHLVYTRTFVLWKRETHTANCQEKQSETEREVGRVGDLQVRLAEVGDLKNKIETESKRYQLVHSGSCRRVLSKWIFKANKGGLQYGFITWRHKMNDLKH